MTLNLYNFSFMSYYTKWIDMVNQGRQSMSIGTPYLERKLEMQSTFKKKELDMYQNDFSEFYMNIINDDIFDDVPFNNIEVFEEWNVEVDEPI